MAADFFMWIESPGTRPAIEGETQDSEFKSKKAFELVSFEWSVTNPSSVSSGTMGSGSGKVSFGKFLILKKSDNASPSLFSACANGNHYAEAHIVARKAGGTANKTGTTFLKFDFKELMVDSIQWNGSTGGDDTPLESITFSFGACQITYTPQLASGSMGTDNITAWSQVLNNNTLAV